MTTTPPAKPSINLRGAVDLSGLKGKPQSASAAAAGAPGATTAADAPSSWVLDVTEETLQAVVEQSLNVPVVIDLWAPWCEPCKKLGPILEKLTRAAAGRILLAKIDTEAQPRLGQAFNVQSVPTVLAIVKGQPVPLFQGAMPEAQVAELFGQLLQMAEQNGVTGVLPPESAAPAEPASEPELPPLHAKALAALQSNDLATAAQAYQAAVQENPGDDDALRGTVQVALLQRLESADADQIRQNVAQNPKDVDAVLAVVDLDIVGGHVEDGFARLIECLKVTFGDDRNRLRERAVDLFTLVGAEDPRVVVARRALASALF